MEDGKSGVLKYLKLIFLLSPEDIEKNMKILNVAKRPWEGRITNLDVAARIDAGWYQRVLPIETRILSIISISTLNHSDLSGN
jgi:hypothetical protein